MNLLTRIPRNKISGVATLFATSLLAIVFILPYQANAALLTQQLDLGDSNQDVSSLQAFLATNSSIYPEGLVTGYFGQLTFRAVARYQAANGLPSVGRVGPQTLSLINSQMAGGGGGGGSTTGDISAPIIYPENVKIATTTATISWTTNEAARSRVMYGTSWPFLFSTAPSISANGYGSTASITLGGLQSKATYHYVLESIDASGNVSWTTHRTITTL